MSSSDSSFSFFGFIFGGLAFFVTWVVAIVMFNFLGLVLGWIPAALVAMVVYVVTDIALFLLVFFLALIGGGIFLLKFMM